jgi:hypothetical protein
MGAHVYIVPVESSDTLLPPTVEARLVSPGAGTRASGDDAVWAALLVFGAALVVAMLVIASPLGHILVPTGGVRFFASSLPEVHPKATQEMRYALAALFAAGLALLVARGRQPRAITASSVARAGLRWAAIAGHLVVLCVVVWTWQSQFRGLSGQFPTTHFSYRDLSAAILIAAGLATIAHVRPNWFQARARPRIWLVWPAITVLLTACWLLPDIFRAQNLAPALIGVTYHLQFTFDDFVAQLNGLTPLVDYNAQYASLLPVAVGPVLALAGTTVGAFTTIMCLLTLCSLFAVERTLAHVTRNESLAFVLYVPFLAASLFVAERVGDERFNFADYFAVFPLRYFGPYMLLWLCVRHLRGLRPNAGATLFLCVGLVLLNNVEFGLPALAATVVAIAAAGEVGRPVLRPLVRSMALGLFSALALVSLLTLLRAGQLPDFSRLTLYSRVFGGAGFFLLPTPLDGFQLIVFMTFVASLLVAGLRYRSKASDCVHTATLAYCGVFGLGAGAYYMGRSHPVVLVALFSVWALTCALLALVALRAPARSGNWTRMRWWMAIVVSLVPLGLAATAVTQFPAPWRQLKRIATSVPPPAPYDVSSAVDFVRNTVAPGEHVVLLAPLGHLIARDAGVRNVSPYSSPADIVSYEQLDEELAALAENHGRRFFVGGENLVAPEIVSTLAADGFRPVSGSPSTLTEWVRG